MHTALLCMILTHFLNSILGFLDTRHSQQQHLAFYSALQHCLLSECPDKIGIQHSVVPYPPLERGLRRRADPALESSSRADRVLTVKCEVALQVSVYPTS